MRGGGVALRTLVVIAVLMSTVRAQGPPPWMSSYQAAVEKIKNGRSEVGVQELEALGSSFPRDPALATSIGAALDSFSRHQQARSWYQKALVLDPQYEPALNNFALSLASQGEFERAVPLLETVLKHNPNNGRAAYNLALITLRLKRFDEAISAFELARKAPVPAAPSEVIALGEGTALFKLRKYAEATRLLNTSSACCKVASCLLLGSSQALSNQLPDAVSTFQTAVRLAPSNPDAYFRLALAFMEGRRDKEAKETLAVGLEAAPNSALLLYGQAIFYEYLGSYDEAIASAKKSIEADPARADVWSLLGSLHAHQGQGDDAEKAYQRAIQSGAGIDTAVEYAEFLVHAGRYSEAEKTLDELRLSHPNDAAVNRGLGKLYKDEGKFDQAAIFLQRAVAEDPREPSAHYALAMSLQRLGRATEAKEELGLFNTAKEKTRFVRVLEIASDSMLAEEK